MEKPIIIIGPMDSEINHIISKLENVTLKTIYNYSFYEGTINNYPVVAIKSFIGLINAATVTTIAIERYNPRCIIIQGTSGSHNPKYHRGVMILGKDIINIESFYTPVKKPTQPTLISELQFMGTELNINGKVDRHLLLHSNEELLKIAKSTIPNAIEGTIASADIWNKSKDTINYFNFKYNTDCEEMEGYAVAQVCSMANIPMIDIRVISNNELINEDEFIDGYGLVCQEHVLNFVKNIITK